MLLLIVLVVAYNFMIRRIFCIFVHVFLFLGGNGRPPCSIWPPHISSCEAPHSIYRAPSCQTRTRPFNAKYTLTWILVCYSIYLRGYREILDCLDTVSSSLGDDS